MPYGLGIREIGQPAHNHTIKKQESQDLNPRTPGFTFEPLTTDLGCRRKEATVAEQL